MFVKMILLRKTSGSELAVGIIYIHADAQTGIELNY